MCILVEVNFHRIISGMEEDRAIDEEGLITSLLEGESSGSA